MIGYLPGNVHNEYVIIGAHYDHLGILPDGTYLGADDNASGTAAVLAITRVLGNLVKSGKQFRRSIIVGFWGAEEWGLKGSKYFVRSDLVSISQVVAMLNLDMVGRNDPTKLFIIGAETNRDFPHVSPMLSGFLQEENAKLLQPFTLDLAPNELFNRTDSSSFFFASPKERRLPILTLSSLLHDDYHASTDTVEKLNIEKIHNVSCLCLRMTLRLAESEERPVYVSKTP